MAARGDGHVNIARFLDQQIAEQRGTPLLIQKHKTSVCTVHTEHKSTSRNFVSRIVTESNDFRASDLSRSVQRAVSALCNVNFLIALSAQLGVRVLESIFCKGYHVPNKVDLHVVVAEGIALIHEYSVFSATGTGYKTTEE